MRRRRGSRKRGTAAQLGFDHLRENLATSEGECVQRGHATLLMDEVDSLVIHDAHTRFRHGARCITA